jgi:hypothetical protein
LLKFTTSAFLACVVLAGIGMALALLLLGRPRKAPQERLEAHPLRCRRGSSLSLML